MKLTSLFAVAAFAAFTAVANAAAPAGGVIASLKGDLVSLSPSGKNTKKFDDTQLAGKKYIAVYFSAHWCGPCRQFTPNLVKWYNEVKPANPHFELVFMSRDHSEKDQEKYMAEAKMPWPAVKFSKLKSEKVLNKFASSGIPHLVLIDDAGNVVTKDGMAAIEKVLKENAAK